MESLEDFLYQRHYKQRTVELFRLYTKRLNDWLKEESIELKYCSYTDILAYLKKLKKQVSTTTNMSSQLAALKQYFNYLKQQKVIANHPCRTLVLKVATKGIPHDILSKETLLGIYHSYQNQSDTGKRDKLMLSFVIFQGLFKNEVLNIEPGDLNLLEGTVYIPGNGKTRARTLKLEPLQIIPLQEYKTEIRERLIHEKGTQTRTCLRAKGNINAENSLYELLEVLKKRYPELKNFQHIRVSLISHWMREKNIREVQYMAGHKTIVGTELYKSADMKGLQESLEKFHPLNR